MLKTWKRINPRPGDFFEILFVGRPKLIICNPKLIICRPKLIMQSKINFKSNPKLIYYKKSITTDPGEVFVNGISVTK